MTWLEVWIIIGVFVIVPCSIIFYLAWRDRGL